MFIYYFGKDNLKSRKVEFRDLKLKNIISEISAQDLNLFLTDLNFVSIP